MMPREENQDDGKTVRNARGSLLKSYHSLFIALPESVQHMVALMRDWLRGYTSTIANWLTYPWTANSADQKPRTTTTLWLGLRPRESILSRIGRQDRPLKEGRMQMEKILKDGEVTSSSWQCKISFQRCGEVLVLGPAQSAEE